jgi:hypothetical protein
MTALKGKLTISRPYGSRSEDEPYIRIVVRDDTSRIQFLTVDIPLANFAECLTGLSETDCDFQLHAAHNVGKRKEREDASFVLSKEYMKEKGTHCLDKKGLEKLLADDPDKLFNKPGWFLSPYLGAQNSVVHLQEDGVRLNTYRIRYVTPETKEAP